MSLNKILLIGNLGKDPEIRQVGESRVANFSLATSEKYKNKAGETITDVEWHNIAVWGKSADIAEKYLKKGSQIYLEGQVKTRTWDDKDGNKRYSTDIKCLSFKMLGGKASNTDSQPQNDVAKQDNDLPF